MIMACMLLQFLKVNNMLEVIKEELKTIFAIAWIIVLTHTLFFMAYGYFMSGDPLIALENFYNIMYNIR